MNKKASFVFGFLSAAILSGLAFYLFSENVAKQNDSMFMAGYAQEVSTLNSIVNETDDTRRTEIAKSELCEAISILEGKFAQASFSVSYIESVVSQPVVEYQELLKSVRNEHCAKNI
ncbi:hypothetical protein GCM10008940_34780 [Microbulbifer agarilyticus]